MAAIVTFRLLSDNQIGKLAGGQVRSHYHLPASENDRNTDIRKLVPAWLRAKAF